MSENVERSTPLSKKYPASSVIPTGFSTSTSSTALCTLPFNSLQKSSTSHDKDDGVGIVLLKNDEAKEIPPEVQTRAKVQVTLPSESAIDLSLDSSEDEWHENSTTSKLVLQHTPWRAKINRTKATQRAMTSHVMIVGSLEWSTSTRSQRW